MCVVFAIHTNRSLNETGRGRGTRIACINMWHTANFRFCRCDTRSHVSSELTEWRAV